MSLLALSFKPVTFWSRSSLICSQTFHTGFGHFHGSIHVASTLGDCFPAVTCELSGTKSRLFLCLYALKEFAAHLLTLNAPATEPGFGFCQQHLEFPCGLPSKYYPGQMLLNLSVRMGTVVSNMAWSADPFIPLSPSLLPSLSPLSLHLSISHTHAITLSARFYEHFFRQVFLTS